MHQGLQIYKISWKDLSPNILFTKNEKEFKTLIQTIRLYSQRKQKQR